MPLLISSTPPLNPIANSRYSEKSLGIGAGISRSDLTKTAVIPRKKNRIGGFRILDTIKLASMPIPPAADETESLENVALSKMGVTVEPSLSCRVTPVNEVIKCRKHRYGLSH